jgi:sulfur-carrier protein adenylyltransferase/sulfurtransferase
MYLWFLQNPQRLSRERTAIEQLEESAAWLVGTEWLLDAGLCLDAVIRAHGHDYQVRMTYPNLFPSAPPAIRPLNTQERLSGHQYGGADGPLCLEWGPDNWHQEITGAQVLESAYNLLHLENPLGEGRPKVTMPVPSRHHLTLGQEVRGSSLRFYVGNELGERFKNLPKSCFGTFKFSMRSRNSRLRVLIHEVQPWGDGDPYTDISIPKSLRGAKGDDGNLRTGVFFKTDVTPPFIEGADGLAALEEILRQAGHTTDVLSSGDSSERSRMGLEQRPLGVIILDAVNDPHFFALLDDDGTLEFSLVRSDSGAQATRTPENYKGLASKSVGIVGAGSVGSKIALTLARMGFGRIYLVDYDIFLPENVERHVLDWRHIADHKVDGVRELLMLTNANLDMEVARTHLTGQESNAVVSGVLNELVRCDLIIDATADPGVFNLLSAVTVAAEKPMVWMEVYAGGTGGMIARSRPGHDPDPHTMRALFNQYCIENPAPDLKVIGNYTAEVVDEDVLTASDADVAIIAHHAARFAVDTALAGDNSSYPYSMYLIGLARWWVFTNPFHTIPIATDGFRRQDTEEEKLPEDNSKSVEFIAELLRKKSNATSSTP